MLRVTGLVKMKDYTPPIYDRNKNPEISYTLKPNMRERAFRNLVTTDGNGFRTAGNAKCKMQNAKFSQFAFRNSHFDPEEPSIPCQNLVVTLGDSITFGYGVADDETLPAQIQTLMPDSYVINAGTPGYHITQEVAFYKEKLEPLEPDALILIFYWNDFETSTSWLDEDNVLRTEGWQPPEKQCKPIKGGILKLIPGKCWLDLHSAFYSGMKEFVNTRTAIKERDVKREVSEKSASEEKVTDDELKRYENKLAELAAMAPENRLFVIWPDSEMHEEVRPKLKYIAEGRGFEVLDLYDHFGNKMETLSWDYMHPSPKSLTQAAEVIAGMLSP